MSPDTSRIVYVTRDIERALGIAPSVDYQIVTNRTRFSETIRKQYPKFIHLIEASKEGLLDTAELLEHLATKKLIEDTGASIVVFKNNAQTESIVQENGWRLLNPSAKLAEKIENKITQVEWLGGLAAKYLPEHSIQALKEITWDKKPFIIQWAHSHTGDGTILIDSQKELYDLRSKFPERPTRKSAYLHGPSFTVNAAVTGPKILMGNVSYQITGLPPFTDNPFSTIGNDWSAAHTLLTESDIEYVETTVQDIGLKLQADGWRGLFGLDFMTDIELNKVFLIEINARQPASAVFESALQEGNRAHGTQGPTMFEAHIAALQSLPVNKTPIPINDGAQIVQRITKTIQRLNDPTISTLKQAGYTVIEYPNTGLNEDLLRIQSMKGIMEAHGKFNTRGKEIEDIISK